MNSLGWYLSLYYKFREYPVTSINNEHNPNELRPLYQSLLKKLFVLFHLDPRKEGEIDLLINKNNHQLLLNKKGDNNLDTPLVHPTPHPQPKSHIGHRSSDMGVMVSAEGQDNNMDVFYELMIKMIRVSLRRLMVQTLAVSQFQHIIGKQPPKTSPSLGYTQAQKSNELPTTQVPTTPIEVVSFPATLDEIKFEFIKYCIASKVYNDPQEPEHDSHSSLSGLSESAGSGSEPSLMSSVPSQRHPQSPAQNSADIEALIMLVSRTETTIFNKVMEMYFSKVRRSANNQMDIVGLKQIAMSVLEMTSGQPNMVSPTHSIGIDPQQYRQELFDEDGRFDRDSPALSSRNILLATWMDLVLFQEAPSSLFQVIVGLVRLREGSNYLKSAGIAMPSPTDEKEGAYYRVSAYMHMLMLNSTKNIFLQSLCKINHFLFLLDNVIGTDENSSTIPYSQVIMTPFQEKGENGSLEHQEILLTIDGRKGKVVWKQRAMGVLMSKWKNAANVITELCVRDQKVFFAALFEKCVQLLDYQLDRQMKLIQKLMTIAERLREQAMISQEEKETGRHFRVMYSIYGIVKEIIGFNAEGENRQDMVEGQSEEGFANKEEQTEELSKWSQIIGENIYIYGQYSTNLEVVQGLFKSNSLYTGLWLVKFHKEVKVLLRKMDKAQLEEMLTKFSKQLPVIWDSMTTDRTAVKKKSNLKRTAKTNRTRISSIRNNKELSVLEKKAIVLNTILKAELQLYSHYMMVDRLSTNQSLGNLLSEEEEDKNESIKPALIQHPLVEPLLLLPTQVKEIKGNNRKIGFQKDSLHEQIDRRMDFSLGKNQDVSGHRRNHKRHTSTSYDRQVSPSARLIGDTRTMNFIDKRSNKTEEEEVRRALEHFARPIDIELDLQQRWKQRFGEKEIEYLSEVRDHIRYLNQLNYLSQLWRWIQGHDYNQKLPSKGEKKDKPPKLLTGAEYYKDVEELDDIFNSIRVSQSLKLKEKSRSSYRSPNTTQRILEQEETANKEEALLVEESVLKQEQLTEMSRRIKVHNKELYMISESISEAENYYKLIGDNLIGRHQHSNFRLLLNRITALYCQSYRNLPPVELLHTLKEHLHIQIPATRRDLSSPRDNQLLPPHLPKKKGQSILINASQGQDSLVSQFELTPQYYKTQSKILRLNCLVCSFDIDNNIFTSIKHHQVLSRERLQKLSIIGRKYYERVEQLLASQRAQNELIVTQQTLIHTKNLYAKKLLMMLVVLLTLNYQTEEKPTRYVPRSQAHTAPRPTVTNISPQHLQAYRQVLKKYSQLAKRYMLWRIADNIRRMEERESFENAVEGEEKEQKQFGIGRFLGQILELSERKGDLREQGLLWRLQAAIEAEGNMKFREQFRRCWQKEETELQGYANGQPESSGVVIEEVVGYLRKKLGYLLMRELYFSLQYDNDFLEPKSVNSKRNYAIYEQRTIQFYNEIIRIDYQDYKTNKEVQLKKRSVHLQNFEFKYQKEPQLPLKETDLNKLVCCLFNHILGTYTSSVEQRMFSSAQPRYRNPQNSGGQPQSQQLYKHYCSREYVTPDKPEPLNTTQILTEGMKDTVRDSIGTIFAQIFTPKSLSKHSKQPSVPLVEDEFKKVRVFTPSGLAQHDAISLYLLILAQRQSPNRPLRRSRLMSSISSQEGVSHRLAPITQMELDIIRSNQQSLITLMKAQFMEKIEEAKCKLVRKNLISNIEKLYVNIDVRHKVFESFKDRILNYEMQKAKIYHQYMDYIRGLKLDVYSHMIGQSSTPYIKVIHAIKAYRLKVKEHELQERVSQEFQKNLQRWNMGIQHNMQAYKHWLEDEERAWHCQQQKLNSQRKQLLETYHLVSKQMQRQHKNVGRRSSTPVKVTMPQMTPTFSIMKSSTQPYLEPLNNPISQLKKVSHATQLRKGQKQLEEKSKKESLKIERPDTGKKASETTKPATRVDRLTVHSKSQGGLRGLSFKYEITPSLGSKPDDGGQPGPRNTASGFRTRPYTSKMPVQHRRNQSANRHQHSPF